MTNKELSLPTRLPYLVVTAKGQPTSSLLGRKDTWKKAERADVLAKLNAAFMKSDADYEVPEDGAKTRYYFGWAHDGGYKSQKIDFHQSGPMAGSFSLVNPDYRDSMWGNRRSESVWTLNNMRAVVEKLREAFPGAQIEFAGKRNDLRVRPADRVAAVMVEQGGTLYNGLLEVVRAVTSTYDKYARWAFVKFLTQQTGYRHGFREDGRNLVGYFNEAEARLGGNYGDITGKNSTEVIKTVVALWAIYEDVKLDWPITVRAAFEMDAQAVIAETNKETAALNALRDIDVDKTKSGWVVSLMKSGSIGRETAWDFLFAKDALAKIRELAYNPSYNTRRLSGYHGSSNAEYIDLLEAAVDELQGIVFTTEEAAQIEAEAE